MKRLIAGSAALLVLAGCNSEPEVSLKNATGAEVAAAAAKSGGVSELRPGQWEILAQIEEVSIDGAPPEVAAQMAKAKGKSETINHCLKPEDARKPDAGFFVGRNDDSCTFSSYEMRGSEIDATITCRAPGGQGSVTQRIQGAFGGDSFALDQDLTTAGGPIGALKMKGKLSGKRTGECTAP